jgi:hypothetical protein
MKAKFYRIAVSVLIIVVGLSIRGVISSAAPKDKDPQKTVVKQNADDLENEANDAFKDQDKELKKAHGSNLPDEQEVFDKFDKAYAAQDQPRIVILLNRELSEDVSEWKVSEKTVAKVSGNVEGTMAKGGTEQKAPTPSQGSSAPQTEKSNTVSGAKIGMNLEAYTATKGEGEERETGSESWKWQFENAFLQPFLDAKAKIVDRATIIRQLGAEESKEKAAQELDKMTLETNALNKYGDIYIEVLVTNDSASPSGYVFKATAKKIKGGEIIAQVISKGEPKQPGKEGAASQAPADDKAKKPIDLEMSSRGLALMLMDKMAQNWTAK